MNDDLLPRRPGRTDAGLARLTRSPRWPERARAAARPDLSDTHARRLLDDVAPVRFALAQNPAIPADVLDRLCGDRDVFVRGVAVSNRSVSSATLCRLADEATLPGWALRSIAMHPAFPADRVEALLVWVALGGGGDGNTRFDPIACIGAPFGEGTERDWYRREAARAGAEAHPLWRVRAEIVSGARTMIPDAEVLAVLAADPAREVRAAVARHDVIGRKLLVALAADDDPVVAERAGRSLARLDARGMGPRTGRARWRHVVRLPRTLDPSARRGRSVPSTHELVRSGDPRSR